MRSIDLELLVKRHVDEVRAGRPGEDDRIELKQDWPDPTDHRRARQLAGAANALRGEPLIYIVGCSEDGSVHPLSQMEPESWHGQIASRFDSVAPRLALHRNVIVGDSPGDSVVALLFETEDFPYVMVVDGKSDRREVPLRVAAGTKSANRSQLLSILAPTVTNPPCELVEAQVTTTLSRLPESRPDYTGKVRPARTILNHSLQCRLLIAHVAASPVSLLTSRIATRIRFRELGAEYSGTPYVHRPTGKDEPLPTHGISLHGEIVAVTGPGVLTLSFNSAQEAPSDDDVGLVAQVGMLKLSDSVAVDVKLHFVGASHPVSLTADLVNAASSPTSGSTKFRRSWGLQPEQTDW